MRHKHVAGSSGEAVVEYINKNLISCRFGYSTDMRKGTDGLSAIVNLQHICDSYESAMFIFCNRSRNRVKILEWDNDGFWLYQKRLEKGTFPWPKEGDMRRGASLK